MYGDERRDGEVWAERRVLQDVALCGKASMSLLTCGLHLPCALRQVKLGSRQAWPWHAWIRKATSTARETG